MKVFARQTKDDVIKEQLYEAERLHLDHQAAAEMHASLASTYKVRIDRLKSYVSAEVTK